ncbi:hypothetical protein CRM22_006968 [Opisthorchis felineus]|uniref:Uncharacterized protein n=1 Tax=Opisthorchis felineus TaxID=147828 RepID=A0A4S2LQY3_OPIFE|nr:hypothetical protein CRM22_006968 [Opisthorchis felineus]
MLKRQLEECRGKREIFFVLCGNKADKPKDPSLDCASLSDWAQRERVHLFETSVLDRQALCNVLTWIVSRVTQSPVCLSVRGFLQNLLHKDGFGQGYPLSSFRGALSLLITEFAKVFLVLYGVNESVKRESEADILLFDILQ